MTPAINTVPSVIGITRIVVKMRRRFIRRTCMAIGIENADGSVTPVQVALENASLASQAVGPPLSDFEMSCSGRTFSNLGRKMLPRGTALTVVAL